MQHELTIRYSTKEMTPVVLKTFTIGLDVDDSVTPNILDTMDEFKDWVKTNLYGNFDDSGNIICTKLSGYRLCHSKAMSLGLLPRPFASNVNLAK